MDSAPVKANTSMDSLELKVPEEELDQYIRRVRHLNTKDKENYPYRKAKKNKISKAQQTITADKQELQSIKSRTKKWAADQDARPGSRNKGSNTRATKPITVQPTPMRVSA